MKIYTFQFSKSQSIWHFWEARAQEQNYFLPSHLCCGHKPSYFNIASIESQDGTQGKCFDGKLSFGSETSIKKTQNRIEYQIQKTALIFVENQKPTQNRLETINHNR